MKSFRLDPELASRLREAARIAGITESEFIREAIARRVAETGEQRMAHRLADVIGVIDVPTNVAGHASYALTRLVVNKHTRRRQPVSKRSNDRHHEGLNVVIEGVDSAR